MPLPTRTISLTGAPVAITATTDYAYCPVPDGAVGVVVRAAVGTVSGTSPTLNVYIQHGFRAPSSADTIGQSLNTNAYTDDDFMSLTQITASNTAIFGRVLASGEEIHAAADRALAAGQIRNGPLPCRLRVSAVVGGVNPSFGNFNVTAEFVF